MSYPGALQHMARRSHCYCLVKKATSAFFTLSCCSVKYNIIKLLSRDDMFCSVHVGNVVVR